MTPAVSTSSAITGAGPVAFRLRDMIAPRWIDRSVSGERRDMRAVYEWAVTVSCRVRRLYTGCLDRPGTTVATSDPQRQQRTSPRRAHCAPPECLLASTTCVATTAGEAHAFHEPGR